MSNLQVTLYVFAFFSGLSVVLGVLIAVHDGIEWLINRRRA